MISLSDFRGKWIVLLSHPADFTPVCTSEFVALAKAKARFDSIGCALIAMSVDSLYSHFGWISAIQEGLGVSLNFPIVEDPSLVIGRAYGMISDRSQDASAMRSSYYVDPEGIIRAITTYPATIGRSVEEMLRIVAALQRVDRGGAVTPEGWKPGDPTLIPPPLDVESFADRASDPLWFYKLEDDKNDR